MIDLSLQRTLVFRFEDAGFSVKVVEDAIIGCTSILIRKRVGERMLGYSWAISQQELELIAPTAIYVQQADRIIAQLVNDFRHGRILPAHLSTCPPT